MIEHCLVRIIRLIEGQGDLMGGLATGIGIGVLEEGVGCHPHCRHRGTTIIELGSDRTRLLHTTSS